MVSVKEQLPSGGQLTIYRASDGYRWQLKAANGEIVTASSEGFFDKAEARSNLIRTFHYAVEALLALDVRYELMIETLEEAYISK